MSKKKITEQELDRIANSRKEELSDEDLELYETIEQLANEFVKRLAAQHGFDPGDDLEVEEFILRYSEIRANEN